MAALHGTIESNRTKERSMVGTTDMDALLETWQLRIRVHLQENGKYTILVSDRDTGKVLHEIRGCYPEAVQENMVGA